MVASSDGFELAERDLEIRGGGALGARQSGLSDLRFARITHDRDLLEAARDAARTLPPETMAPEVDTPRRGRAPGRVVVRLAVPEDAGAPRLRGGRQAVCMDTIALRTLSSGERAPVLEVFSGLSERSRPALPRREAAPPRGDIVHLVDVGRRGREAVAAVDQETGLTVGIARYVRDPDAPEAEIAFEVVDRWQGQGIGKRLVAELRERCEMGSSASGRSSRTATSRRSPSCAASATCSRGATKTAASSSSSAWP